MSRPLTIAERRALRKLERKATAATQRYEKARPGSKLLAWFRLRDARTEAVKAAHP